jgi:phage/plasmid primase-like uncharacterized protein
MTDITGITNGPFTLEDKFIESPENQLRNAMLDAGIEPPRALYLDGNIHRFSTNSKGQSGHGDKPGWYVCFSDSIPAGRFGDWRSGIEMSFRGDIGRKFTVAEEMVHARRLSEAMAQRDLERDKKHELTEKVVEKIWDNCLESDPQHPYLQKKRIQSHRSRVTGDGRLVVPLRDIDGAISTLQYISGDGSKLYHKGGSTSGKFWTIGNNDNFKTLYIAEGFATAATIHEQTGDNCIVAYSASNLVPVTGLIREKYGIALEIIIIADNDASGVGMKYAEKASATHGARIVMPPNEGDANDFVNAGGDFMNLVSPRSDEWLVPADDLSAQPAPLKWMVRGWIQENALIMVHGPSGGGKTFMVLDQLLSIAAGLPDWAGCKVKAGTVVYFAGEGHHGLRGRIAAWKHHNIVDTLDMWVSKDGCDLNTPTGYQRVRESLIKLTSPPKVIVFDTLHRFLLGDENSAQDAKTMLDACSLLMNEFLCSVILVHHTGVSSEAQHRARGSSAWRGALDIEISIVPGDEASPMEIHQKKSKDAELAHSIYANLEGVDIPGWRDEDGEQVSSAVLDIVANPKEGKKQDRMKDKKEENLNKFKKYVERAFFASHCELRDGLPYVSRSAILELLTKDKIGSERTIENWMCPGRKGSMINVLIENEDITPFEQGYKVTGVELSTLLLLLM